MTTTHLTVLNGVVGRHLVRYRLKKERKSIKVADFVAPVALLCILDTRRERTMLCGELVIMTTQAMFSRLALGQVTRDRRPSSVASNKIQAESM